MKILLAVDDSSHSRDAMRAIRAQFSPRDTEVRVLHVLQPASLSAPPQMSPAYAPELREEGVQARALTGQMAEELRAAGFRAESAVQIGDVREEILRAASQWPAELIVVGSHGTGRLRHLVLGSVAEFVARHAPCSAQIVRAPAGSGAGSSGSGRPEGPSARISAKGEKT